MGTKYLIGENWKKSKGKYIQIELNKIDLESLK